MAQPLAQHRLTLPSEYELVWLPQPDQHELHVEIERPPKSPVRVHAKFVDFLHERGFPFEVI